MSKAEHNVQTRFGKVTPQGYQLQEMVGESPSGAVWKATRDEDGLEVALKLVDPQLYATPEKRAELLANLEAAQQLRHPCLAQVLDAGIADEIVYVVFEFVQGLSLERMLKVDGEFPEADALAVCQGIVDVLLLCEGEDLVHGNLTLTDVLVDLDGTPRLTDVGLYSGARDLSPAHAPEYLAPERQRGEGLSAQSDLYSLGVCLYRLLTGQLPPEGGQELPDPRELAPDVSEATAKLLRWLSASDLQGRYLSADQVSTDLILVLARQEPNGPNAGASPPVSGDTSSAPTPGRIPEFLDEPPEPKRPPTTTRHARASGAAVPYTVRLSSRGVTLGVFELDEDVASIGRSAASAIHIDNPIVSRRHAEICRRGQRLFIRALSSTNSTMHDGAEVAGESELAPNDVIILSEKFHLNVEFEPGDRVEVAGEDDKTSPIAAPAVEAAAPPSPYDPPAAPAAAAPSPYDPSIYDLLEADNPPTPPRSTQRMRSGATPRPSPHLAPRPTSDAGRVHAQDAWAAPRGYVVFIRAGQEVRSFISHAFQVGTSHACDVRLPQGGPRKAALLVRGSDGYRLYNTSEGPLGVYLNGEPVPDQAVLQPGDEIVVFGATLRFGHEDE